MAEAKNGDKVSVHYTGTLADGSVFDSSLEREPLDFELGAGQMIPGFEQAVIGMKVGDKTQVSIGAEDAYGPRQEEMLVKVPRGEFPDEIELVEGNRLQMTTGTGEVVIVTISAVGEEQVTLDANHFLAGQDLNFEIELISID